MTARLTRALVQAGETETRLRGVYEAARDRNRFAIEEALNESTKRTAWREVRAAAKDLDDAIAKTAEAFRALRAAKAVA